MPDRLEELASRVARGELGAAEELAVLLRSSDDRALSQLARHRSERVRSVVASVLPGRVGVCAAELASTLAADREPDVRRALAQAMADDPAWGADALYEGLLDDSDEQVSCALLEHAIGREGLLDALSIALLEHSSAAVRARLCALFAQRRPELALPLLVESLAREAEDDVERAAAVALGELVKAENGLPAVAALPRWELVEGAIGVLQRRGPRRFARVVLELTRRKPAVSANASTAGSQESPSPSPRAFEVDERIEQVLSVLRRPTGRAVMLVGESGVGKTALVNELARRELRPGLATKLVRMSPADFLVDTKYLGEWESKLKELVESRCAAPGTVLYVPSAHDLATIGTTVHSSNSVAAALAPYIERGALTVIGETTPAELAAGLGRHPALRRVWTEVELRAADEERTRRILRAICEEAGTEASEALLERVVDYSELLTGLVAQPGRSAGLLRGVLARLGGEPLTLRAVLGELQRVSGVPTDLLDDELALDTAQLRDFFAARVMGQREAVESVVDLVTLFKAGLNDPGKPLAVLLFVGPTGVGKTELARALAERLFGDPNRLLRFDMSEYATYDAFERLHGASQRQGSLTTAVRERPLSVVLLDEIEKAHPNVFDLCLQIFDAGRLTDGAGRTVDFRRSIVIMTSNLGSAVRVDPRLGFGASGPASPAHEDVQRELRSYFRPEFLARIDRVVHFEPLSLETAEQIARRELARVLERRGIERRHLSIDVDPALVSLLLREGYSQAFGARPLKRTIERRVLLPLARAIAGGPIDPGSILRLRAEGAGEVRVDVVRDASETVQESAPGAPQRHDDLQARGQELRERIERLEQDAQHWNELRSDLVEASNSAGRRAASRDAGRVRDELHRVDQLLGRVETLARAARSALDALGRTKGPKASTAVQERIARLAGRARALAPLVAAREPAALGDALLELTSVKRTEAGLDGVALLARMYQAWARRAELECEALSDRRGGEPSEDSMVLAIRGAGAHLLLRNEDGLHTFQQTSARAGERRGPRTLREAVRVDVHATDDDSPSGDREGLWGTTRKLAGAAGRAIAKPTLEARVFDSERATSAVVWTNAPRTTALAHARLLLEARAATRRDRTDHVVRRYQLGPSPLVKDLRTGRQTGKLHRVLDGELDEFLASG